MSSLKENYSKSSNLISIENLLKINFTKINPLRIVKDYNLCNGTYTLLKKELLEKLVEISNSLNNIDAIIYIRQFLLNKQRTNINNSKNIYETLVIIDKILKNKKINISKYNNSEISGSVFAQNLAQNEFSANNTVRSTDPFNPPNNYNPFNISISANSLANASKSFENNIKSRTNSSGNPLSPEAIRRLKKNIIISNQIYYKYYYYTIFINFKNLLNNNIIIK